MTRRQLYGRSVRIKVRDLVVIRGVMDEVDLDAREEKTKGRVDSLIKRVEDNSNSSKGVRHEGNGNCR